MEQSGASAWRASRPRRGGGAAHDGPDLDAGAGGDDIDDKAEVREEDEDEDEDEEDEDDDDNDKDEERARVGGAARSKGLCSRTTAFEDCSVLFVARRSHSSASRSSHARRNGCDASSPRSEDATTMSVSTSRPPALFHQPNPSQRLNANSVQKGKAMQLRRTEAAKRALHLVHGGSAPA
jgi:hypothetical protein